MVKTNKKWIVFYETVLIDNRLYWGYDRFISLEKAFCITYFINWKYLDGAKIIFRKGNMKNDIKRTSEKGIKS